MGATSGGETIFHGSFIADEPPLTESQYSLRSLCQSIDAAQRSGLWTIHGFNDHALAGVEPLGIRQRAASVLGDALLPSVAELHVDHYYGRQLCLSPPQDSHLSHVSVGYQSGEVPQQRVVGRHHEASLAKIDGVVIEPLDDDRILARWEGGPGSPYDWQGHVALSFWYRKGKPGQRYASWDKPLVLAERIELSTSESERGVSPLLVGKIGAPEWGGDGTEVYDAPWLEPQQATEAAALGFLGILREVVPQRWLQREQTSR